jgi:hypothetical protein
MVDSNKNFFPAEVLRNLFYKFILHLTTGYPNFRRARFLDQNSYSIRFGFCQPIVTHRIAPHVFARPAPAKFARGLTLATRAALAGSRGPVCALDMFGTKGGASIPH